MPTPPPILLTECPRDAMQGLPQFIATADKIAYLQQLLAVGFDTLDFGSFVSPKAIPQLRDTAEVLAGLDLDRARTRLLAIVANQRGAEAAASHPEISYLGFPLSLSETFQRRNTNQTIAEALADVAAMHELCERRGKTLLVYLSMGFGNPYGDLYSPALVVDFAGRLAEMGICRVALSDTIGAGTPALIGELFGHLIPALPHVSIGAHLHATPATWHANVAAAYQAGCRCFDSALGGLGGCPMAADVLTGNLATENLVAFLQGQGEELGLDMAALAAARETAVQIMAS